MVRLPWGWAAGVITQISNLRDWKRCPSLNNGTGNFGGLKGVFFKKQGIRNVLFVMAITYVGDALPIVCCNRIHGWEAIMRSSSITQLIIGTAVAMSVVAVSAIGSAVAQSPVGDRKSVV